MRRLLLLTFLTSINLAILAPQALAQSSPSRQIKPPELTKVPAIKNEKLQVIPPNTPITGVKIVNPASQLVAMEPPPDTHHEWVSCHKISITSLAFKFHCSRIEVLPGDYYTAHSSSWIIRRDGTQPSWALKAEDFERIKEMATKDKYGDLSSQRNQFTGESYVRLFVSIDGQKPPGKYCAFNPMKVTASSNRSCYDIMSVFYTAPKED